HLLFFWCKVIIASSYPKGLPNCTNETTCCCNVGPISLLRSCTGNVILKLKIGVRLWSAGYCWSNFTQGVLVSGNRFYMFTSILHSTLSCRTWSVNGINCATLKDF